MTQNIYSTSGRGAVTFNPYPLESLARQRATAPLFYDCVWIDGELVPAEDANVRNELGIFEEIRCYPTGRGPAIFRLEAHLERFLHTARTLGAGNLRYSLLELRRAVHVTAHVNSLSAGAVRTIVYVDRQRGGDFYPSVAVVAAGHRADGARPRGGVRLMSTTLDQDGPDGALTHEALQSRGARATRTRAAARRRGFDEAILVGRDGMLIDCTGENLFLVHNGAIYTAPVASAGDVARDTALTLLRDLGYRIVEQPVHRDQLARADELFLCGVASEIVPVGQADGQRFSEWPGPVTRRLQQLYAETTRGEGRRSRGWLEYVMMEPLF